MAQTHHTRYVSIQKESPSAYNTPASNTGTKFVGEVESESFAMNYDILKRADMNYYGARAAVTSIETAEGSVSMALQPDAFTLQCIHGIMGKHTPGVAYTDVGTLEELLVSESTALPSFTFFVGRDDKQHSFGGQVIESISVSASVGEYAMMTVNSVGASQTSSTETLVTDVPSYTGDAAHFATAYVNFGAEATSSAKSQLVQSVSFDVSTSRDLDNSYGLAATTCLRPPPPTMREITGSLTFHKGLLSGDVSNNEPYYEELLDATGREVNAGSAAPSISVLFAVDADNYIRFDFFSVIFEMAQSTVSGRDSQTMTVNFHALYDAGDANSMMKVTYKTSDSAMDNSGTPIDLDA